MDEIHQNNTGPEQFLLDRMAEIKCVVAHACHSWKLGASPDNVEEISQQIIFLLLKDKYRRLLTFDGNKALFRTWLITVVNRHIGRNLKKLHRTDSIEETPPESVAYHCDVEEILWNGQKQMILQRAASKLSARERELLDAVSKNQHTVDQIAVKLGIKVDSVYRRKHALVKKLKQLVNSEQVAADNSPRHPKNFYSKKSPKEIKIY